MSQNRLQQIKTNYERILARIKQACEQSNRKISDITVIAVTKTYPAKDIDLLSSLGIENVGENKDQEANTKFKEVKNKFIWHFVGQLQSNKVKSVIQYADYIHSVDRVSLVKEIQKSCQKIDKIQKILIQIDLDESNTDENRGGVLPSQVIDLASEISNCPNILLAGLMSVAPLNVSAQKAFSKLQNIQNDFLKSFPDAKMLSAGMSDDLESAILHGATHLRIGSALLGERPKIG
jgi:pyridoxal phosphate enzyme (YggS family)